MPPKTKKKVKKKKAKPKVYEMPPLFKKVERVTRVQKEPLEYYKYQDEM